MKHKSNVGQVRLYSQHPPALAEKRWSRQQYGSGASVRASKQSWSQDTESHSSA